MYRVKILDGIKEHKVALVNTHECDTCIYSQTNHLGHFSSMFEIGVTHPLNIYWMKTFSIYKQVFILTKWSYSDMWTINTLQDTGKFRQLIVLICIMWIFSALSEENSIQFLWCRTHHQFFVKRSSLTSLGNRPKCWKKNYQ